MTLLREFTSALDTPAVGLVIAVLAVVAAAHAALHWWVIRKARQEHLPPDAAPAASAGLRGWLAHALRTIASPLAFLLWTLGISFALHLLLPRLDAPGETGPGFVMLAWACRLAVAAGLVWLLARIGRLAESFLGSIATRTDASWDDLVLPLTGKAIRRGLPLLGLILSKPMFALSPALEEIVEDITSLLVVGLVAFVMYQCVDVLSAFVLRQHRLDVRDNLQARTIVTQITVLRKVAIALIALFALASMLMVFEPVRQFGASILASAGIAGIVVGFAAQRSIGTLLAGFQIVLSQPIRLDDFVIVEGERGRIEEITLTYVVVRTWDLRRLVVPITYFIEKPFQNWTRVPSNILVPVFINVDYTLPIQPLRTELTRVLQGSPRWDGQVNVLQVTGAKEQTLELRALGSAVDAGTAWELGCEIREALVSFVQAKHPTSLPRVRAAIEPVTSAVE